MHAAPEKSAGLYHHGYSRVHRKPRAMPPRDHFGTLAVSAELPKQQFLVTETRRRCAAPQVSQHPSRAGLWQAHLLVDGLNEGFAHPFPEC